jgi:hypothetical protein
MSPFLQLAFELVVILLAAKAAGYISTGMGRIHQSVGLRDDQPFMFSMSDFYGNDQELCQTIFTIIRDELVGYIISATEKIAGDLNKPGNGILIVLPTDSV